MNVTYPKIPRDEKKSVKIKTTEYENIRYLYKTNKSITHIAKLYNVSWCAIKCIIDPNYKQRIYDHNNFSLREKLKFDNDYRSRRTKRNYEWNRSRNKNDLKFKLWLRVITNKNRQIQGIRKALKNIKIEDFDPNTKNFIKAKQEDDKL